MCECEWVNFRLSLLLCGWLAVWFSICVCTAIAFIWYIHTCIHTLEYMATANRIIVSVDVRGVLVQVELLPLLLLLLLFLLLFFHFILNFDYTANTLMSVFLDSWCPLIRALCAFVYAYKSTRCFSFAFKCSQSTFIHSVILILAFPLSFSTLFTRVTFGKSCRRSSQIIIIICTMEIKINLTHLWIWKYTLTRSFTRSLAHSLTASSLVTH